LIFKIHAFQIAVSDRTRQYNRWSTYLCCNRNTTIMERLQN